MDCKNIFMFILLLVIIFLVILSRRHSILPTGGVKYPPDWFKVTDTQKEQAQEVNRHSRGPIIIVGHGTILPRTHARYLEGLGSKLHERLYDIEKGSYGIVPLGLNLVLFSGVGKGCAPHDVAVWKIGSNVDLRAELVEDLKHRPWDHAMAIKYKTARFADDLSEYPILLREGDRFPNVHLSFNTIFPDRLGDAKKYLNNKWSYGGVISRQIAIRPLDTPKDKIVPVGDPDAKTKLQDFFFDTILTYNTEEYLPREYIREVYINDRHFDLQFILNRLAKLGVQNTVFSWLCMKHMLPEKLQERLELPLSISWHNYQRDPTVFTRNIPDIDSVTFEALRPKSKQTYEMLKSPISDAVEWGDYNQLLIEIENIRYRAQAAAAPPLPLVDDIDDDDLYTGGG